MTITPFWGEGFISPVPLHLALNYCSHSCSYCFANLNTPKRTINVPSTMRLLSSYQTRKSYEAQLLRWKTPVCVSNLVDPFAGSNGEIFLPLARTLTDLGIPIQFQTRGASKPQWIDEILSMLDYPTVWYISVSMLDDTVRQKIEPGAPTIDSRFALMERLTNAGHHVVLGYNPCVAAWQDDPEPLLRRAVHAGASGAWIESLHFTYTQIRNMSPRQKEAVGDDLIRTAQKRKMPPQDADHFYQALWIADDFGLDVYSIGQGYKSDFFKPYYDCYPTAFPTIQSFINHCYDTHAETRLITFNEFADFMCEQLPAGVYPLDSYLGSSAHHLWKQYAIPTTMTFRQLLAIAWQEKSVKFAPVRSPCFAYAGLWDDGVKDGTPGWYQLCDERGMPYLVFQPLSLADRGFPEYYTDGSMFTEREVM